MNMEIFNSFHFDNKVKVTKTHVLQALGRIPNKKTLKFHLELNFTNLQERKYGKNLDQLL